MTKPNPATTVPPANAVKPKVPKHRSPNYPAIGLERALTKVALAYADYKRHLVPVKDGMAKMEYSADSSTGQQVLAAMKNFGLVELEGLGDKRQMRVSERAAKIVTNHADRDRLIREAALLPPIHKELWEKYSTSDGLAPDPTIRQYLVWDRADTRFSEEAADTFLPQFKQTISFAKLGSSGKVDDESSGGGDVPDDGEGDTSMEAARVNKPIPNQKVEGLGELRAQRGAPGDLPLPILMPDGSIRVVHIPTMTDETFEFFKKQLEAYKAAIVRPKPVTPE